MKLLTVTALMFVASLHAGEKTLIDYFLPTPIRSPFPKEQERGNDTHGSKIIVVPFDGAALDRDLQAAADAVPPGGTSARTQ